MWEDHIERIKRLVAPNATEAEAEEAGRRSVIEGANQRTCHFRFFATPELTQAWERGKRAALTGL